MPVDRTRIACRCESLASLVTGALALAIMALPAIAQSEAGQVKQSAATPAAVPQVMQDEAKALVPSADGARLSREQILSLIDRTASRYGVERALARAVTAAESAYDSRAVSPVGARGLMQVMPATAADYGVTHADALFDPEVNVTTGVRHLKRLLDKYANDYAQAIMAYNAGEGAVDRSGGQLTYLETLNYTETVIRHYRNHGGNQPTADVLKKVAALRQLRGTPASASARNVSLARNSTKGMRSRSRQAPPSYSDLADGYLDRALRSDVTDGDFGGQL